MFYLWEDGNLQRLKLSALPLPSLESKPAAKTKLELDVIGFNYFSFTSDSCLAIQILKTDEMKFGDNICVG